jgi:hypothetical protein
MEFEASDVIPRSHYRDEQKWNVRRCQFKHYGQCCFMSEHPASDSHAAWVNGLTYVTWTA